MRPVLVFGSALAASAVVATAALVAAGAPTPGQPQPAGRLQGGSVRPAPVVEPVARQLLERAAAAPATTAYSGTQYATAWSGRATTAQVLEVSHDPATGTTWRPAGASAGRAMHASAAASPSLLTAGAVALMARHYSLATGGEAMVAGRPVDVVVARRPEAGAGGPVAARFWLDRETALVLRREVYQPDGRPSRSSAFVDIAVRPGARAGAGDDAWPEMLDAAAVRDLRRRGWTCPETLPGPLDLVDARRDAGAAMLHLSYADGIDSVSLFQQRGRLDEERLQGYRRSDVAGHRVWTRSELPRRLVWSEDGMVYTLVADAPQRTVEQAVALLYPASDAQDSRLERLGRGLDRVASWFNPLD